MSRVLIVDDDVTLRRLMNTLLVEAGNTDVRCVGAGSEAIEELATFTPDLMIFDLRLPDMDGATLYRQARTGGYLGPVLTVTASSKRDALVEELREQIGETSILFKPFDIDDFVERVELLLHTGR